jgi:hypothetical protein
LGSDAVVIVSGGVATEMLKDWVAVVLAESFTCVVKLLDPAAVGVPEITPPADRERPAGSAPPLKVHEYPPVPPEAVSDCEYATPTVPAGSDVTLTVNAPGFTLIVSDLVAEAFAESLTLAVKLLEPAAVGVPVIAPAAESERPAGSAPLLTFQA